MLDNIKHINITVNAKQLSDLYKNPRLWAHNFCQFMLDRHCQKWRTL